MPYTAPWKPTLAAQHIEYSNYPTDGCSERAGLVRSQSELLQNSRPYSSTSYVRRHRRTPSISSKPTVRSSEESTAPQFIGSNTSVLRQSPPPLNNAAIPPGAIMSPPESALNSSDEECSSLQQGINIEELTAAVKGIEQRKPTSPDMGPADEFGTEAPSSSSQSPSRSIPTSISTSSSAKDNLKPSLKLGSNSNKRLSKEARKISHSRSSTETDIDRKRDEVLISSPDDSDAESICSLQKPSMVRKKSGELVRPALRPTQRRPSSMPGTPVYAKAVHFDSQLEHIRHFLQLDKPLAVSAQTSPVETHDADFEFPFPNVAPSWEWELRLCNFPKNLPSHPTHPVRLEKLSLSSDKNVLVGTVAVANLSFHKKVAARFTFDFWRTTSEIGAVYCHDIRRRHAHDGYDRFTFDIKLNDQVDLESKTMFVCIRYNVDGKEYWDNNHGMNYQVDFFKTLKKPSKPSESRPSLPHSRTFSGHSSPDHRSSSSSFNDFPKAEANVSFSSPFTGSKPLKSKKSVDDIDTIKPPKRREKPHPQAFGHRYDFGASLSAAMQAKSPLDRTTLTARARSEKPEVKSSGEVTEPSGQRSPTLNDNTNGAPVEDEKPASLLNGKPCLESSVYKELVDRYCFYGSPKSQSTAQTAPVNVPSQDIPRQSTPKTLSPLSPPDPSHPYSPRLLGHLANPVLQCHRRL
ncbi:hypothetical protein N7495_004380 [Penicillium taxi]|uniref:uncharacterized protein n=1 Tax=Penicillium taxi TaxID=168475 RepID=UPI002545B2BC|nr:uncharacterized protein N7495_004380 [Penicillium taxi]KAJ5899636.1 hypothetical protein N7495_004380 [Penicillium taxi]